MISYAMINKETLSYICEQRNVSTEYLHKKRITRQILLKNGLIRPKEDCQLLSKQKNG